MWQERIIKIMYITTQKRNKVIAELRKNEKTQEEIAKEVGISTSSVYKISRQIGIKRYGGKKRQQRGEQLCWMCSKAYGGCNWSACFEPVEGWTAEPIVLSPKSPYPVHTYHISECPEYEKEVI